MNFKSALIIWSSCYTCEESYEPRPFLEWARHAHINITKFHFEPHFGSLPFAIGGLLQLQHSLLSKLCTKHAETLWLYNIETIVAWKNGKEMQSGQFLRSYHMYKWTVLRTRGCITYYTCIIINLYICYTWRWAHLWVINRYSRVLTFRV